MCRFGRFVSKAYSALFSISATLLSTDSTRISIEKLHFELECWRKSIPEEIRPSNQFQPSNISEKTLVMITIRIHYSYYSAVIALSRLCVSIPEGGLLSGPAALSKEVLVDACRSVIELTSFIEIATYTPIWLVPQFDATRRL